MSDLTKAQRARAAAADLAAATLRTHTTVTDGGNVEELGSKHPLQSERSLKRDRHETTTASDAIALRDVLALAGWILAAAEPVKRDKPGKMPARDIRGRFVKPRRESLVEGVERRKRTDYALAN